MNKEMVIDDIIENYVQLEQSIVKQLYMRNRIHGGTTGGEREDVWRQMFEMIVPKKFVIEQSVFIIDSTYNQNSESIEGISTEVDLAIIDENYTPYIFRYGRLKFVPIEAVAAVIECKSSKADLSKIENWSKRIDCLKTSNLGIARMATGMIVNGKSVGLDGKDRDFETQTATRPIKIYCSLEKSTEEKIANCFDFVINAHEGGQNIRIYQNKDKSLFEWYDELNKPKNKNTYLSGYSLEKNYTVNRKSNNNEDSENVSLLTFNFQLNQLLMLINNPLLFPHQSYVKMFNKQVESDNHG